MNDAIIQAVEGFVATPWVYVVLFGIAALDGFFPVVPSETLVITLGVFAASSSSGEPQLFLVILVAALGAFTGDHISYAIGRRSGDRIFARLRPGSRTRKAYERVGKVLAERGGLVLVVARYIPGGRTAATLTTGATGFPRRSFTRYDAIAASTWAVYSACLGFLGGAAFEDEPLLGVALGLGLAFSITLLHEAVRYVRRGRAPQTPEPDSGLEVAATAAPTVLTGAGETGLGEVPVRERGGGDGLADR
ncbi:DedA family protein [Streptomyces sp. NPDC021093]|uniref:DedA family protein n=1 Tax=Streptomyces sp. NPDC021093 TaxID=3365112 RepID=UPI0037983399